MRRTIISVLSLFLSLSTAASSTLNSPYPPDAVSLLSFKSTADLDNKLLFNLNERYDYCQWRGVKCVQGRVIRLSLDGYGLRGVLETNTLSMLDQLRVLSLRNNSLFGLIPDLSPLFHLKSLFLGDNHFSGAFPPSILKIHRIREIDLSYNNFSGPIPVALKALDWIEHLRLESNRFNGSIPPLNQTLLNVFNVSGNDLFGLVPRTLTLSRFNISSFLLNPKLCGKVVNRDCYPPSPFFNPSPSTKAVSPPSSKAPSADSQGTIVTYSPPPKKHTELILGFTFGAALLIFLLLLVFLVFKKQNTRRRKYRESKGKMSSSGDSVESKSATDHKTDSSPMNTSVKPEMKLLAVQEVRRVPKSGNLVFCSGETRCYTLEQLMRASAELLGRGTIGTTYKAVLDNQLILSVKRLDAIKTAMTSGDAFKRNMELVGGLRHPKLVPVRAYFQAEEERLIVYDYHPNGSLFKLIHGSRSSRAKPLHWTSCLKIAEDVAQGLAYMHQASSLVHGNLKSTNILLGPDFEACLTDNSLAAIADTSADDDDPIFSGYRAPETRKSSRRATQKADVYSFGVLLMELLTGKHPSQHPYLIPTDMPEWVRAMRDDDRMDDNHVEVLTELASFCSLASPEMRPTMPHVLRMIEEIKATAIMEDHVVDASRGFS